MADPSEHSQPCPRCAVLEHRVAESERLLAAALARISDLETRNAKLENRNAALEALLEQRTRDASRQAAAFSNGFPKPHPEKPGRKPGKDDGTQAFRRLPDREPDQVIDVPLPRACLRCGGPTCDYTGSGGAYSTCLLVFEAHVPRVMPVVGIIKGQSPCTPPTRAVVVGGEYVSDGPSGGRVACTRLGRHTTLTRCCARAVLG